MECRSICYGKVISIIDRENIAGSRNNVISRTTQQWSIEARNIIILLSLGNAEGFVPLFVQEGHPVELFVIVIEIIFTVLCFQLLDDRIDIVLYLTRADAL